MHGKPARASNRVPVRLELGKRPFGQYHRARSRGPAPSTSELGSGGLRNLNAAALCYPLLSLYFAIRLTYQRGSRLNTYI